MPGDGVAKQLRFGFQPFAARRLLKRHLRETVKGRRRQQPALAGLRRSAESLVKILGFPKLPRARLAEFIKASGTDDGLHLLVRRIRAPVKIGARRKAPLLSRRDDPFHRLFGKPLGVRERNPDPNRGTARLGRITTAQHIAEEMADLKD